MKIGMMISCTGTTRPPMKIRRIQPSREAEARQPVRRQTGEDGAEEDAQGGRDEAVA